MPSMDLLAQSKDIKESPHYTKVGFFDIHVCNWPERKLFLMSLFATTHFNEIKSIDIFFPDGKLLTRLDQNRYKLISKKGTQEKRAFINQTDVAENAPDGWYTAKIHMNNGDIYTSKDYVEIKKLPMVSITQPLNSDLPAPYTNLLSWKPVSKDAFYQVFIRDIWDEEKLVFKSKLSTKTSVTVPDGLMNPGNHYKWVIHARNINEHPLYGDFNHGSMSSPMQFKFEE